ncbi:Zn(II)2Cys6 transcription factor domain-containing protein [Aspergillus mulundensis]|uniref:Zn(2)-C6 fungal-type domain-containing protein n=1 Tax=Aspergillus mulundensis TaxID=1810919 RepID=A0A3D8RFB6_9EURO|nr:hypothetical protein DSM5745_07904 [Aspergillus mulundensis]RDW72732.1 hypothetical protein DSM5745_07904 [Aspergillus mulundensis]
MVNRGPSGGCATCRQRRVKCDEGKPECRTCGRLKLRCGGYRTQSASTNHKFKFRDQTHKFKRPAGASVQRTVKPKCLPQASPTLHSLSAPDTAVPFFLLHYALTGRDMESARGFYEILVPEYAAQPADSALCLAVSALASETLSLWRRGAGLRSAEASYTQALACLRRTVSNATERGKTATLLTALALQMYENVAAIYGLRSGATRIHHDGAVSLLSFAAPSHTNKISAYVRRYILHSEVSSALRQKRSLRSNAYSLIATQDQDLLAAPDNPSSTLDLIGTAVAELQARYDLASQDCTALLSQHLREKWHAEANRLDEQLLSWAQSVPSHWQPVRLTGSEIDPSIPTYNLTCEIYPSCQIANVWNLWRCQRLILAKITLTSLTAVFHREPGDQLNLVKSKQPLQDLVDSLCYSVPFYLGNRMKPSSMRDFTDPSIVFPTSPPSDHAGYPAIHPDNHKRHLIAQGHWHIMSPLGCLLSLLSEDGQILAGHLREGQADWIRGQFLRVATLLRLRDEGSGGVEGRRLSNSPLSSSGTPDLKAESLAKSVRRAAVFLSGP